MAQDAPELRGALDPGCERPESLARLHSWMSLQRAAGLRPTRVAESLSETGDPAETLRQLELEPADPSALQADLEALRRCGALALPFGSPAYPARLAALRDAPPLLWVRGRASALHRPAVAVVGSRAATRYGLGIARRLGRDLARAGLVVVSGLARGVDAAAHRGALEAEGSSLAFLACGPDRVYPQQHRELAQRLLARGAVVTELPPGTPPRRELFPLRNRLLSGVALALVVVEARERSGSLGTAVRAAGQDLDVFAVPGPVDAPTSQGPNRLLHEGAYVARDASDVLHLLEQRGVTGLEPPRGLASGGCGAAPEPAPSALLDALRQAPATRDELARRLERSPESLALELLELELQGRVAEDRDGRLRPR